MGWKWNLFKAATKTVSTVVSKSFDFDLKGAAANAVGIGSDKPAKSRDNSNRKVSDRTGYEGYGRPYEARDTWRVLGTPKHYSSVQFWASTIKHRDVWAAEGVEIVWEEDSSGNIVRGSFHTKIQKSKHANWQVFGKKLGIEGPITFED